jgi:transposase
MGLSDCPVPQPQRVRRGGASSDHDDFLRCLENAFAHFGGLPKTLVIDNLRAAVSRANWFDPELCPKVRSFAEHYGIAILPTKPYTPRHKGKIERGIGYVKANPAGEVDRGKPMSSISIGD